jgi:hypothetical protein
LGWDPVQRITEAGGDSHTSSVAVDDSGNVHLVWADQREGFDDIYYTAFDGETPGFTIRLTRSVAESKFPSLAVGPDGRLHMVWRDARDGNFEIYYKTRDPLHLAGVTAREPDVDLVGRLSIVPNPVGQSAKIGFRLRSESEVRISLYDITGRLIWQRDLGRLRPGSHSVDWNRGPGSVGRVAPGIYLVRVRAEGYEISRKLAVLR